MSEASRRKNDDPAWLEDRVAALEESLARVNTFNSTVMEALTHILERLREFEKMTVWAAARDYKMENNRSMQALAQASKIFPKTRSVVFVSKGYFGDNVKYAYLAFYDYARAHGVAVNFLTDDPHQSDMLKAAGLPCLSAVPEDWSAEDIRALLGAKVVVMADNFGAHSFKNPKAFGMLQGAKTIQLWHGIPIKEIGLRYVLRGDNVILDELLASAGEFDVLVAPGAAARGEWAQRFAFRDYAATGYPRTDVFFREPTARDLLNIDREIYDLFRAARSKGKPTIIYTPTYRDDVASAWFSSAGIDKLAAHAEAKGYVLAVNLHPYEQSLIEQFHKQFPGIRFIAPGTDIYPIVREADILITDYSSLAFDFLLLDRSLIFYRPDGDKVVEARGFIETMVNEAPGGTALNADELVDAVDTAAAFIHTPATDSHRSARQILRAKLFDHVDGDAAQRLCEVIIRQVEAD